MTTEEFVEKFLSQISLRDKFIEMFMMEALRLEKEEAYQNPSGRQEILDED